MSKRMRMASIVAVACWLAVGAYGQTSTVGTVITSDTLEYDYGNAVAHFEGNVVVVDPEVTIRCSRMIVEFSEDDSVKSVLAKDNVQIEKDEKRGYCDRAVYTMQTGAIVMTGHAKLQRGRDVLSGKEITIYVDSEKVECRPGKLVVFPGNMKPEQGKTRPTEKRRTGRSAR